MLTDRKILFLNKSEMLVLLILTALLFSKTQCDVNASENIDSSTLVVSHLDVTAAVTQSSIDTISEQPTKLTNGDSDIKTVDVKENDEDDNTDNITDSTKEPNENSDYTTVEQATEHSSFDTNNETLQAQTNNENATIEQPIESRIDVHNESVSDQTNTTVKHVETPVQNLTFNSSDTTILEPTTTINSTTTNTTSFATTTSCLNCTSPTDPPDKPADKPIFKSFNLNYLYLLLLLIPLSGIFIGAHCYCRKKKKKEYIEPTVRPNANKRFSTPSWVFSEPDFDDEEVETLKDEEKK
jgi:hypothetical protein